MRCHQNQLRARKSDATRAEDNSDLLPDRSISSTTPEAETKIEEIDPSTSSQPPLQETVSGWHYPTRARGPQDRLEDSRYMWHCSPRGEDM